MLDELSATGNINYIYNKDKNIILKYLNYSILYINNFYKTHILVLKYNKIDEIILKKYRKQTAIQFGPKTKRNLY